MTASPFGGHGRTGNEHQSNATRQYEQEADQATRKAMLRQDQQARTYFEMAQSGDPDAPGRTPVTGATSRPYGHDLPGPAWSKDLASLPKERPLGERVDAVNDISAVWFDPDYVAPEEAPDAEA